MTRIIKKFIIYWFGHSFIFILNTIDVLVPHTKRKKIIQIKTSHKQGVSVIIPERDSVMLLEVCIPSVIKALAEIDTESEIIIIANGSNPIEYRSLQSSYPLIKWHFSKNAYGFAQAIKIGLEMAVFSWVYLLNNDMRIKKNALSKIWEWHAEDVFALASQIFFEDKSKRREETGYTGFNKGNGSQGLYDRKPDHNHWPAQHMYAGGGATLFQKTYLMEFIEESHAYAPFYWEDVEWGLRAQQQGLKVLFIPQSHVVHRHRATVSRFYSKDEIQFMFMKNGIQCNLRNKIANISNNEIENLYHFKILTFKNIISILKSRWHGARSHNKAKYFGQDILSFYPKPFSYNGNKPWIVWVVPFAISPVSHGSARRVISITKYLSQFYRIALLSDEGWTYNLDDSCQLSHFNRVDLVVLPRVDIENSNREQRIRVHSHRVINQQLKIIMEDLKPIIIQIEHEELCNLIPKSKTNNWFITLHDVNHNNEKIDNWIDRRLKLFNRVICCSNEDALLIRNINTNVIENGTDILNSKDYHKSNGFNLLFVGPFRYKPNLDGICHFITHSYNILKKDFPKLTLTIISGQGGLDIANNNPIFDCDSINLLGHTDKVKDYIHDAVMTINPLLKIRGSSLKTLESLANGRICISTTAAARGFLNENLSGLQLADTPQQWYDLIGHLLTNQTQRHKFESPKSNHLDNFNWSNIANKYRRLYEKK